MERWQIAYLVAFVGIAAAEALVLVSLIAYSVVLIVGTICA